MFAQNHTRQTETDVKNPTNHKRRFQMLRFVSMLALMAVAPVAVAADVPTEINHQGVVTVNTLLFTGDGHFYFALVDPDTNTNLWTSDGTNLAPSSDRPISPVHLDDIANGVYSVRLGSTDAARGIAMPPIPASVFNDDNVVLRIWFDDTQGHGIERLLPDQPLTTSPYAFRAAKADVATKALNVDHLVRPESTTTALVVDAQGNVGIGTETPSARLEVDGQTSMSGDVSVDGNIAATGAVSGFGIVPVGSIIAWHKHFPNSTTSLTPALPDGWVECKGQTLNDPESLFDGQVIPHLNSATAGAGRYLRGHQTSGTMQAPTSIPFFQAVNTGVATEIYFPSQNASPGNPDTIHFGNNANIIGPKTGQSGGFNQRWFTARPTSMTVVWIIRVK